MDPQPQNAQRPTTIGDLPKPPDRAHTPISGRGVEIAIRAERRLTSKRGFTDGYAPLVRGNRRVAVPVRRLVLPAAPQQPHPGLRLELTPEARAVTASELPP